MMFGVLVMMKRFCVCLFKFVCRLRLLLLVKFRLGLLLIV